MSLKSDLTKFVSVLEAVGKDVEKALVSVAKYAVPVATLVGLLFPAVAPEAIAAATAVDLIQQAVLEVEAKATALPTTLTGAQKLADVLQLVQGAVINLLATEKITVNQQEVTNLVNAVVAILNVVPAKA